LIVILESVHSSQRKYFNHWAYEHTTEQEKEKFLIILQRMHELT